jgi:hypothetical protein
MWCGEEGKMNAPRTACNRSVGAPRIGVFEWRAAALHPVARRTYHALSRERRLSGVRRAGTESTAAKGTR